MRRAFVPIAVLALGLSAAPGVAVEASASVSETQAVAAHWTSARMADAIRRDVNVNGLGRAVLPGSGVAVAPNSVIASARQSGQPQPAPARGVVPNAPWLSGGDVQRAIGRLYFEMTIDGVVGGYVCSGTEVTDSVRNYSTILTAAHCVYDDYSGAFATNVMFIPDQVASGTHTDLNCSNDLYGCWIPTQAAVDPKWASVLWPDNLAYDYGFYLVPNSGRHVQGLRPSSDSLEQAIDPLEIGWSAHSSKSTYAVALGYSWVDDPSLMYCSEAVGSIVGITDYTNLWLANCALSGGSSGGPWLQTDNGRVSGGDATIFSLNSWGFDDGPGMAGPVLQDPARGTGRAHRLFNRLGNASASADALTGAITTRF